MLELDKLELEIVLELGIGLDPDIVVTTDSENDVNIVVGCVMVVIGNEVVNVMNPPLPPPFDPEGSGNVFRGELALGTGVSEGGGIG